VKQVERDVRRFLDKERGRKYRSEIREIGIEFAQTKSLHFWRERKLLLYPFDCNRANETGCLSILSCEFIYTPFSYFFYPISRTPIARLFFNSYLIISERRSAAFATLSAYWKGNCKIIIFVLYGRPHCMIADHVPGTFENN
jgi:hypothetical protein